MTSMTDQYSILVGCWSCFSTAKRINHAKTMQNVSNHATCNHKYRSSIFKCLKIGQTLMFWSCQAWPGLASPGCRVARLSIYLAVACNHLRLHKLVELV
jgi:hypothetical protein